MQTTVPSPPSHLCMMVLNFRLHTSLPFFLTKGDPGHWGTAETAPLHSLGGVDPDDVEVAEVDALLVHQRGAGAAPGAAVRGGGGRRGVHLGSGGCGGSGTAQHPRQGQAPKARTGTRASPPAASLGQPSPEPAATPLRRAAPAPAPTCRQQPRAEHEEQRDDHVAIIHSRRRGADGRSEGKRGKN